MSQKIVRLLSAEVNALLEYSCSLPTGTAIGKHWKRNMNWRTDKPPRWWRGEYVESAEPGMVDIEWMEIEIYDPPLANIPAGGGKE